MVINILFSFFSSLFFSVRYFYTRYHARIAKPCSCKYIFSQYSLQKKPTTKKSWHPSVIRSIFSLSFGSYISSQIFSVHMMVQQHDVAVHIFFISIFAPKKQSSLFVYLCTLSITSNPES